MQVNRSHSGLAALENISSKAQSALTNRWIKVVSFGLAVTFTSCLYAGWQQYSLLLYKGGKYAWLCDETLEVEAGIRSCPRQDHKISALFSLVCAFELFGAIIAGVGLDWIGPRWTAIVGSVMGFVANSLLVVSGESMDLLPAAFILTGISINLIAFPALSLEKDFPKAAATTAAYVVSCQCLSSIIAPIMWFLWRRHSSWTFQGIWVTYLFAIWLPTSLFYWITLPNSNVTCDQEVAPPELDREQGMVEDSRPHTVPHCEVDAVEQGILHHIQVFDWREFLNFLISPVFIAMMTINILLMLASIYYQLIVRKESGPSVSTFLGWTMPLQAIWGLLLGRLTDYIKTPAMTLILLYSFMFVYTLILFGQEKIQYGTATLFNIAVSYAYTVKYSFIREAFPEIYFGTFVGILGCIGGLSIFLVNILVSTWTHQFWCIALAGLCFAASPASLWLCFSPLLPKKAGQEKIGKLHEGPEEAKFLKS